MNKLKGHRKKNHSVNLSPSTKENYTDTIESAYDIPNAN